MRAPFTVLGTALLPVLLFAACGSRDELPWRATMRDATGRQLGTLSLSDAANGIRVAGTLRGLPPGEHGFHLHTTGVCAPNFDDAGGHWNPTNKQHGRDNPAGPHFGDLANITVAADGTVEIDDITPGGTLHGQDALLDGDGAAVMVHDAADDYRSDPAGEAGSRIACGIATRP
ncbi:MAG TPA: superoxide dismutase family protein [Gemmatimonadaceae bacterium]|jgi:Cu-Zn family superoxide dismutase|nr:superoxide dismutase family protein [Gemmatimonadaceae bacterium]